MRQADEFVIVLRIGAQTADGDGHTALKHTVELRLRTVGFLKVMQELPGSRRQLQFLCAARNAAQSALICSSDGFSPLNETKHAAI